MNITFETIYHLVNQYDDAKGSIRRALESRHAVVDQLLEWCNQQGRKSSAGRMNRSRPTEELNDQQQLALLQLLLENHPDWDEAPGDLWYNLLGYLCPECRINRRGLQLFVQRLANVVDLLSRNNLLLPHVCQFMLNQTNFVDTGDRIVRYAKLGFTFTRQINHVNWEIFTKLDEVNLLDREVLSIIATKRDRMEVTDALITLSRGGAYNTEAIDLVLGSRYMLNTAKMIVHLSQNDIFASNYVRLAQQQLLPDIGAHVLSRLHYNDEVTEEEYSEVIEKRCYMSIADSLGALKAAGIYEAYKDLVMRHQSAMYAFEETGTFADRKIIEYNANESKHLGNALVLLQQKNALNEQTATYLAQDCGGESSVNLRMHAYGLSVLHNASILDDDTVAIIGRNHSAFTRAIALKRLAHYGLLDQVKELAKNHPDADLINVANIIILMYRREIILDSALALFEQDAQSLKGIYELLLKWKHNHCDLSEHYDKLFASPRKFHVIGLSCARFRSDKVIPEKVFEFAEQLPDDSIASYGLDEQATQAIDHQISTALFASQKLPPAEKLHWAASESAWRLFDAYRMFVEDDNFDPSIQQCLSWFQGLPQEGSQVESASRLFHKLVTDEIDYEDPDSRVSFKVLLGLYFMAAQEYDQMATLVEMFYELSNRYNWSALASEHISSGLWKSIFTFLIQSVRAFHPDLVGLDASQSNKSSNQLGRAQSCSHQNGMGLSPARMQQKKRNSVRLVPVMPEGLKSERVSGDGNCFFHAIALHVKQSHKRLRQAACDYMQNHLDEFAPYLGSDIDNNEVNDRQLNAHIRRSRHDKAWADQPEIIAMMKHLNRPIIIIQANDGTIRNYDERGECAGDPIFVCYDGGSHYNGLLFKEGYDGRRVLSCLAPSPTGSGITTHTKFFQVSGGRRADGRGVRFATS